MPYRPRIASIAAVLVIIACIATLFLGGCESGAQIAEQTRQQLADLRSDFMERERELDELRDAIAVQNPAAPELAALDQNKLALQRLIAGVDAAVDKVNAIESQIGDHDASGDPIELALAGVSSAIPGPLGIAVGALGTVAVGWYRAQRRARKTAQVTGDVVASLAGQYHALTQQTGGAAPLSRPAPPAPPPATATPATA